MIGVLLQRYVLLAIGLAASVSGPALALTHGHAHGHAQAHLAEHHEQDKSSGQRVALEAHEPDGDHVHPRLDPGASARTLKQVVASIALRVTVADAADKVVSVADPPTPTESPPHGRRTPPANPRAPPVL